MSEEILYEQTGNVVTLTLNRPDTRNPLGAPDSVAAFVDAAARINADRSVRAVVLTGAGKAFSAGGDVKAMRDKNGMFAGGSAALRESYRQTIHKMVRAVWSIEVPVVAAVNGPAIGAGCDLTCLCDTRIASDTAKFGVTFLKLGLIPGDGGAWLLPRIIGMARASELFYTGDVIGADEAKQIGLVSRVVPHDDLLSEANATAQKMAMQAPDVLRMTKRLLRAGMVSDFDTVMEMSASYQAVAHLTDDHAEAVNAFFDKRAPVFEGK